MANIPESTGCGCPEGYELIDNECVQESTTPAEYTGNLLTVTAGNKTSSYSKYGLRLYPDVSALPLPLVGAGTGSSFRLYDNYGTGPEVVPLISSGVQSTLWGADNYIGAPAQIAGCGTGASGGRLNTVGIWATGAPTKSSVVSSWNAANPSNLYADLTVQQKLDVLEPAKISFEFCVDVEKTRQYLVGIAGDNEVFIEVDGVLVAYVGVPDHYNSSTGESTLEFNYWHVFPLTIPTGQRTIKLSGINYYSLASFGAEIYDISLSDFQANLTTPFSAAPDCGNEPADLEPYIIFSTRDYIGQQIPDPSTPGQWTCPDGSELDFCNGVPQCSIISKVDQLSCCYLIDACDNEEPPFLIQLDPTETTELVIGNIYSFADRGEILRGCYKVLQQDPCDSPVVTLVTVSEDYGSDSCEVCVPCYELTDCANPENTLIIKWDKDIDPLDPNQTYIFDFAPNTCWTPELQFSPCEGTLYTAENITDTYVSCEECNKVCYRITDCTDPERVYYTEEDYSAYVGSVIQYSVDDVIYCASVDTYICRTQTYDLFPYTVEDCFKTCEACYPPPPEPAPVFEVKSRTVKPGYDTPACTPAYWDKVKCRFSEIMFQQMATDRYGIEFCCEDDKIKWEVKNELLNLAAINDPDICNETCDQSQTEVTAGEPQCLPNGFYTVDLTVTYPEDITTGQLIVNGQSFDITGTPQVVTLELLANGAPVDVSISFTDSDLTEEFPALFTAPEECEPTYATYRIVVPPTTTSIDIFYKNQNGDTLVQSTPFGKSEIQILLACVEINNLTDGLGNYYEIDGTCQSLDGSTCISTGAITITTDSIC